MEQKVNKRNIRDRLLSLFIVLGMLMGLFTGLATPKQAEAADSLKRTIKLGGDDFIEYDPRYETITYKRIHPLAHSTIRYYTHDFVLSINPVDSEGEEYLGNAVDIDEFRLNPESVKTVKQLRIPLQFDPDNPGESLSQDDAEAIGKTTGYYWWDAIDVEKDIVTTTYVFNADIIYDFLDACGASTTDKVYIHHVFAMKWPGHDGDSICTLPKHEPYWQLKDKNGHLGIVDSVTWSDKSSVYKAMKNCLNIRVPLYREVPVMINYYDVETGAIVGRSKSSSALTMLDGSVDQFTRKDPFTIADLSGTIEFDGVDYSLVTDSKDYETRRPFVIFSAVTTMPVNTASTYDAHYNLAADVSAYYSSEWIDLKDSMGFSKLAWYRYNCTYDGLRRQVSFRTKILYSRTNVLGVYVPVKKTGADIYVNFYNKDTGKGFSSISAVQLEGADVNATNTLRQFEVPESLANEYELAMDGAFDVHGTDANKVKKYSDAKSMSTKKEGAYAPLAKKYTIKEAIAADNTYCIWIPLQKKTPEREIWVGFYDADTLTQVGTPFQKTFNVPVKEGDKNFNVSIDLPSGTEYAGYTIKSTGAFDIPAANLSSVKSYANAKNSTAKRNGTFTGSKYTISEIPVGQDVIIWVPLTKGEAVPIPVYVQYVTNTGEKLKNFKADANATLGSNYTHTAENSFTITGSDGKTKLYVLAGESQYGSRSPRALYSTTSNDMLSASYNGTYKNNKYEVTRSSSDFSFTPTVADTKAVKLFIPYVEQDNKKTNVRIVYINSQTGDPVGSMVEKNDMVRGDTIIPSSTLPSGYTVDLSDTAPYKRLAVYKEGSTGIQSDYNQAKSKIPSGAVKELAFNGSSNCNCDIPMSDAENLAVKVFVPVKPGGDTMVAVKYFYMTSSGKYEFIDKEPLYNQGGTYGRYEFNSDYSNIMLRDTLVAPNGKTYSPETFMGMLYGDNAAELYGSEKWLDESVTADNVYGYVYNASLGTSGGRKALSLTTMDKGSWHVAYVFCTETPVYTNLVIHYINADTGEEIFKETDKNFLHPSNGPMTWVGVENDLVWGYCFGNGMIKERVTGTDGKVWSPVYYAEPDKITEHDCSYSVSKTWNFFSASAWGADLYTIYFCDKCGGAVRYTHQSGTGTLYSVSDEPGHHEKVHTFSFNHPYKTRWNISSPYGDIYSKDMSYNNCYDAKFDFTLNSDGKGVLEIQAYDFDETSKTSTEYMYPTANAQGTLGVLYIPCVPDDGQQYNVNVKYITLKSDGSADEVIAEANGGKAKVGEKYSYTGANSVEKNGKTYSVIGEGEWLTYGSYKYGQGKGDTGNTKGNPAEYDGGNTWTTLKNYSQEKDGTLYIPVAPAVKVTVKYVTLKSGNKIKKTIATMDGGYAFYGKKYSYTGDVAVTDSAGKQYVVVGSGEALAYGSNKYADALTDSSNTKGHKANFNNADTWKSAKKYNSYEDGTLYIPVKDSIPVTIIYFTPISGGPNNIKNSQIVASETGTPGIPGNVYETLVKPAITVGDKTYEISDKSKTGIYWPTSGKTEKVWDYTNDVNIRTGTSVSTTIPSDAEEFYILVPVKLSEIEEPEPEDPDDDKVAKVWDPTPKAVIKAVESYDVEKAIPSSEYVYSEITTDKYIIGVKLKNVTGSKDYSVTVTQAITIVDPDDNTKIVGNDSLSKTVTISRNYNYWVLDDLVLYGPSEAWVKNGSVDEDFTASFTDDFPTIVKSVLGDVSNHVTDATYSSTTSLTAATVEAGTAYSLTDAQAKAAATLVVGNVKCKNDTLKIGGKTIIDSTEAESDTTDPVMSNVPDKSAAGTVKVATANLQIPDARTNIKYDSTGEITYVLKDEYPSSKHSSTLTVEIPDINPVKVHTPVLCKLTIDEDNLRYVQDVNADKTKAHAVVGRSDSDGSEGYQNSTNDFVLKIDLNGKHIGQPGYGTRSDYDKYVVGHGTNVNGTEYPKGVMVNFPFDVVADVGGDGNEANDIVISANTWTRMYPSFYVPEWVEPGTYKVKVCVYAINALGKEDKEQKNKNTTDTNYVAYDEAEIEISGKVYGLTLTSNTSTAPDWENVFTLSSRIKWAYPTKYADGTYLDTFDKNNRYYYMTGIRNELGLDMKTLVSQTVKVKGKDKTVTSLETKRDRYIFPLIDGSSPVAKGTGTLKSGYTWNFQISTAGRVTANDNATLVVVPSFYWVSRDGKKREKVDVWYSGKIDGKTYNLIKVGSELDKKNVFSDYALSETMGIPKSELSMVETLRGNKDVLSANTPIYTYGMISLGRNTKTFPNETYASLFKSKVSTFTEKQLMQFKQNWYFKYSMPDVYHICAAGTDVEAYAKKNGGVTYKESFWHTRGYLVIHFDIGVYDKNGKLVLTYTNSAQNVADGMCDMWNMEGYVTNRTDTNGTNFTFVDGDVILLRLPGSTTPGTPDDPEDPDDPGKPKTPGDPNPPTNSSEDKQVNRTN